MAMKLTHEQKQQRLMVAAPIYAELLRQFEPNFDLLEGEGEKRLAARKGLAARLAGIAVSHAQLLMEANDGRD